MDVEVIVGPPGTGKTTTLIGSEHVEGVVGAALAAGVDPSRTGVVSFTKAAVGEARTRAMARYGMDESELINWRTLHSLGLNIQGGGFKMLTPKDMREFEAEYGYQISAPADEDGFAQAEGAANHDNDDQLVADVYQWARARRESIDVACETWRGRQADVSAVRRFAEVYPKFKAERSRQDFTDMLEGALGRGAPALDLLVIDEAQDLSPLQIALAEQVMARAKRVVIAGDDDQAIMGFQGASARWLIELTQKHPHRVLAQSWRVPRLAHMMAQVIAGRIEERIPKRYDPRAEEGWVRSTFADLAPMEIAEQIAAGRSVSWLGRTRFQTSRAAAALFAMGVPYTAERGGRNPLGSPALLAAARCALRVHSGLDVTADDVDALLKQASMEAAGLKRGAKKAAGTLSGRVTAAHARSVGLEPLWRRLEYDPWAVLDKIDADIRSYYAKVLRRDGEPPENACTVTTMHASKGREWDVVLLSTDHSAAVQRSLHGEAIDADPEHRVAYVAATRTRWGLVLVQPPRSAYTYDYPWVH